MNEPKSGHVTSLSPQSPRKDDTTLPSNPPSEAQPSADKSESDPPKADAQALINSLTGKEKKVQCTYSTRS